MSGGAVSVTIGGVTYVCPPMPFYCLERAWPHIRAMSEMQGDFVAQTREALGIIAASLALDPNPPSVDDLAKRMMGSEVFGLHAACTELLAVSGMAPKDDSAGEAQATERTPARLNGTDTSLN